jgi:hypothetical protein
MSDTVESGIIKTEWKLDSRSQKRYLKLGNLNKMEVRVYVDCLPDVADQIELSSEPQPALGLFDKEHLALIQKSFPKGGTKARGY